MADLSPNLSIIQCKWFKYINEKTEIGRGAQKQSRTSKNPKEHMMCCPTMCCPQVTHLKYDNTDRVKLKEWKKIYQKTLIKN